MNALGRHQIYEGYKRMSQDSDAARRDATIARAAERGETIQQLVNALNEARMELCIRENFNSAGLEEVVKRIDAALNRARSA